MTADFTTLVLGDRPGVVCLAFGRKPYRDRNNRYKHQDWTEVQFTWPGEREAMTRAVAQEMVDGEPVDVYVCPAVRQGGAKKRRKGDALPPLSLWFDLDGPPSDQAFLDQLGALIVASGQPGHRHGYVPLSRPIDLGTHAALNKALAARLGADAKWSDESLLRLPGTWNWKPTIPPDGTPAGEKLLVTVEQAATRTWDPADLAAELGVGTNATMPATVPSAGMVSAEPLPSPLPRLVRWALEYSETDRSRAHARLVGACLDAHLTLGQTLAVAATYRPSTEKYGARLGEEVTRFWLKALDERQRQSHGQNGQNSRPGAGEGVSGHFGHASGDPWNETPTPLGWQPRPLPTDALGPVLGPLADAIAESYQVPADLAVNLALPLITTAAGGRWTVQITPDWSETLALATLSALASGERKSPVMRVLADPLIHHERAALLEARPRIGEQQAKQKIAEDRAEKLRKDAVKSGLDNDSQMYVDACQSLAEMVVDPVPRWLVDDITPEAIAMRLAEHGSIGAVSAEPGLFAILAGRYSNGAANVETVLKATSGDSISVDRMGRDPIHVDSPALSISMCIQPGRLTELGGPGKVFRGSGLLARLLYVLPEARVGTRSIWPKPVPADVAQAWTEHLGKLLAADIPAPAVITVDHVALARLDEFRAALEPRLHPNHGALAGIADWGSKLPGTVVRIAAALTLLADPYRTSIDEATMTDAIRLGEAYTSHAQAAFATIHAADDNLANARGVLDWLRKNGEATFSLRDVYRALRGRAWIEKADDLRPVLGVLVDNGHIRNLIEDRSTEPGRPSERYELHPAHLEDAS